MTRRLIALIVCLLIVGPTSLNAQSGAKNGEWRSYGGDTGSTRYSPLDQINASNFNKLEVAWRFKTDSLGPRPEYQYEGTPLMANGVLYVDGRQPAGRRRARSGHRRAALDAQRAGRRARIRRAAPAVGPRPGVLDRRPRRTHPVRHARLPAHRAEREDRRPRAGLRHERRRRSQAGRRPGDRPDERRHRAPCDADGRQERRDRRRRGQDRRKPQELSEREGATSADSTSGPASASGSSTPFRSWASSANETWEKESWVYTGNTGVWGQISIDEELGLAYLPVEMPTGDYYGGHRPGAGLFGESLVAVDLQTGKRKWHYQLVHHGIWDMDIPARRFSPTSRSTAGRSKPSRSRPSRACCTCSIA